LLFERSRSLRAKNGVLVKVDKQQKKNNQDHPSKSNVIIKNLKSDANKFNVGNYLDHFYYL
jgi:hypothetical protein